MRTKEQIRRNRLIALLLVCLFCSTLVASGATVGYHIGRTEAQPEKSGVEQTEAPDTTTETSEETNTVIPIIKSGERVLAPELVSIMIEMSDKHTIPLALIIAMAERESGFNPDAVSRTNDYGLMQINKINYGWLNNIGINPTTPKGNIEASCYIISTAIKKYGDYHKALMAYNCGDTGAAKLWKQGVYSTAYSRAVMENYAKWDAYLKGVN